jgi:hypothetical protein
MTWFTWASNERPPRLSLAGRQIEGGPHGRFVFFDVGASADLIPLARFEMVEDMVSHVALSPLRVVGTFFEEAHDQVHDGAFNGTADG